jgi:aldehyde:ferredoxin oxidoreductase
MSDFGHVAATGGVGSVMGSKNLKAVVVQGDFKVPVEADVKPLVRQLTREWTQKAMTVGPGSLFSKWGTQIVFTSYHKLGWVPVKNLTTNLFPEAGRFDAKYLREQVFKKVKRTPCHACTYDHCRAVEIIDGPYQGLVLEDPEYEDLAGWGPNVGVTDPRAAAMLTHVNDGLGMDLKECSFTISLAMECYEKGLLTPKDTEGIDLSWGNVEGILQLMKKISHREGIGDLLADGVKRSADRIGREAPQWAVYVKRGIAPHIHDPRTRWGTLFAEAISDTGSIDGIDFTTRNSEDLGIHEPTADPDEKVAFAQAKSGPLRHVEDSIMNCYFFDRGPGILSIMVDVLNAVTGFEYSTDELLKTGDRITNLLRAFNIREGLVPEDDSLSPRLLTPPENGPQKGKSFLETFSEVRRTYYREKGWDERTGKPLPETLKKLQLDDVIEDIW